MNARIYSMDIITLITITIVSLLVVICVYPRRCPRLKDRTKLYRAVEECEPILILPAKYVDGKIVIFMYGNNQEYPLYVDTGSEHILIPNSLPWVTEHNDMKRKRDVTFIGGKTETAQFINAKIDIGKFVKKLVVGLIVDVHGGTHSHDSIGTLGLCPTEGDNDSILAKLSISEIHIELRETPGVSFVLHNHECAPYGKIVFQAALVRYYDMYDFEQRQRPPNYFMIICADSFGRSMSLIIDTGSPYTMLPNMTNQTTSYVIKNENHAFTIPRESVRSMPANLIPPYRSSDIGILGLDALGGYHTCISLKKNMFTIWQ